MRVRGLGKGGAGCAIEVVCVCMCECSSARVCACACVCRHDGWKWMERDGVLVRLRIKGFTSTECGVLMS